MRIVFTGTHSTGKTTLLSAMSEWKEFKDYHICTNLTRSMKQFGYNINEMGDSRTQWYIMFKHVDNIMFAEDMISDRCLIDCFCYTQYLYNHHRISLEMYTTIGEALNTWVNKYDKIFFIRPEFEVVDDGERSADKQFQQEVSDIFDHVMEDLRQRHLPIVEIHGTVEERLKQIKDNLQIK